MRFFFLGAPVHQPPFFEWTKRAAQLGGNTGNLLIGQSLFEELDVSSYDGGLRADPKWIDETFDFIAIPSANFLFYAFDLTHLAAFIERTTLPCLVVGLGAQAPTDSSLELNLQPGTRRFLSLISERSVEIGVRGNFTADAVSHLGVKNVCVTGCPSLFRSLKPDVKIRKRERLGAPLQIAVNGSRDTVSHAGSVSDAARIQRRLLELALQRNCSYVLQSELPEIGVQCSRGSIDQGVTAQLEMVIRDMGLDISVDDYVAFVRRQCRVFFDLSSWDRFIQGMDLSIGSRFHGNLIALTNGVPALMLTHDSRTQELADLIKVPRYRNTDLSEIDVEALYDQADFDAYEREYAMLFQRYKDFLIRNKVAHRLHPR